MTSPIENVSPPPEETVQTPRERVPDSKATEDRNTRRARYGLKPKSNSPDKFMDLDTFGSDDESDRPKTVGRKAYRAGFFVKPLTELYTTVGVMIAVFDQECGTAVITSAQSCAESLDKLAQTNESVKKALYSIIETSTIGAVIAAHLPIILAIVSHHVPGIKSKMGSIMGQMNEATEEK